MGLSFRLAVIQLERKRRRRRCTPEIPMDVMVEILTKLPVKSLMRFKCVSNLWSSLICSQYFSKRFLMVPSRPCLYMCVSDLSDYRNSVILSLAPDTCTPSSFVVDHDLTMECFVTQNLHGFMCYTFLGKPRIYNPATRQLVTLPAIRPGEGKNNLHFCFGYDPVNDQTVSLIEYGGKANVLDYTHLGDKGMMDLWVLEDAGNKEWSRKTLVLQPSQLHLVNNNIITFKVKGTTQSGKVFFVPAVFSSPFHVFCYDLQSNDMRKIELKGIPDYRLTKDTAAKCFDFMFMDQSESIKYLHT
ncbi:unnamed protein product [Thlaspi arvense]|uniref:F-box domain-containing protein n=1 Tax=Thlaspi arvense TaxID=13288 RepID=A0AAU9R8V1_THLAR|nr:unnamed protein product [Thlaspi arvense]